MKILIFDIETSPNLGYIWGKYEQNVIEYDHEWYMLCYVAKWFGDKKMIKAKLPDYWGYKRNMMNDKKLVKSLWKLFDEADVIIGHNGDKFDIKKSNARFAYHGLPPPSPYKTIDTLKVARRYFKFNSNKLDDLGQLFGIGKKLPHEGFELWKGCMFGNKAAWNKMMRYNVQDVKLLEALYIKLLPWITNHPNVGLYNKLEYACPNCGGQHLHRRGFAYTRVNKFQKLQCQDCGAWSQQRKSEKLETRTEVK